MGCCPHFTGAPDPCAAQAQAQACADIAAACIAVAGCQAVTTWGIDDSKTWLDRDAPFNTWAPHMPLLLDASLMAKAAYFAVRDAITRR